ncbi:MAG: hypothetical protein EB038_08735 [Cyclobacteriaceae bacterium]|nr:hypothetical protein [Cyclobacteriaceae bacterium]
MDKGTKNALLYTAGVAAAYLGYKYYKKKQGQATQAPSLTSGNQPPQTGAAVTQATTKPVSKAPASPTFGGASSAYTAGDIASTITSVIRPYTSLSNLQNISITC